MTLREVEEALGLVCENTGTIMGIFRHMEITEEVLALRKAGNPGRAEEIDRLFPCRKWPAVLYREGPESLYRLHVNQLVDKLLAGKGLDTPTGVEMACMLVGVAERAPIKYDYLQYLAAKSPKTMEALGIGDYEAVDPKNPMIEETFCRAFEKVGVNRERQYKLGVKRHGHIS